MASRKENLTALFTNTRSRVIIIFTGVLLALAVTVGIIKLAPSKSDSLTTGTELSNVPAGIQSVPGSINPTAQYASLQQSQNVEQAQQAAQTGGSAIPTIIRTEAFGQGVDAVGPQQGEGGVGFSTLSAEDNGGVQQSLWLQSLKDSNCSKATVDQVVTQGAALSDLKKVCSCAQLKDDGYKLSDLKPYCPCQQLKAAGFNARQLKEVGLNAGQLRACGFSACELRDAGFSAQELMDGGFPAAELKGAGFSDQDIMRASGLPDGIEAKDVRNAGCNVVALTKLHAAGVTAPAIRRISGCSAAQLKAAGFSAADLKNAGFSAADLKNAGFTPAALKEAGYEARDLLNAGFTPAQLAAAGYTPQEMHAAEAQFPPEISAENIKNNGCSPEAIQRERMAGVSAILIHQNAGCDAQALKEGGFTADDLANAKFTPAQINALSATKAAAQPVDDNEIRAAGCDAVKLKTLFDKGVTAKQIHTLNGCSAAALKAAGYDAKELADAGFTPDQLLAAGFTPQQLMQAGLTPSAVIAAGRTADCSVASLQAARALGVSATTIKQSLGCSAAAMKAAGYTAAELKAAGFTAAELKNAGFTAAQLKDAGFTAKELRAAGFSAQQLKDAGFSLAQLKDAGFNAIDLKNLGFTAAQLKAAGFSAQDLKAAGFSADALLKAGYSGKDLKAAGFSAADLKNAGLSDQALQDAGFVIPDSTVATLDNVNQPAAITTIPSVAGAAVGAGNAELNNTKQLQEILKRQQNQMADQLSQQKLQQQAAAMLAVANQSLQAWKVVNTQVYIAGSADNKSASKSKSATSLDELSAPNGSAALAVNLKGDLKAKAAIKTGDIVFAVLDTSINSDEPGPILATIETGQLKGAKLIGSFNLPSNADKLVISFNTLSIPGAEKTIAISAFAIDPNTARTALSSSTNHHYLARYGSLFASTFLEGFGNAFQSAGTTVTIGGTGGLEQNTTIQNGVGRSVLENAVIGLATLGKSWGQVAQQQFNRPTTVEVCSGTGLGILFTQDVTTL